MLPKTLRGGAHESWPDENTVGGSRVYFSDGKWFSRGSRKRKITGFPFFFRIFRSENDLKFKFRFSTFSDRISVFSDRISVFSDRKMLLVIGNCKISEEKLKILQHFV